MVRDSLINRSLSTDDKTAREPRLFYSKVDYKHSIGLPSPLRGLGSVLAFFITLMAFSQKATAQPVVSAGTTICGNKWFYGYQSVGITYTVGDSNSDLAFAVGGSVPSGCNTLKPSTYLNDECAIVEVFSGSTDTTPEHSILLGLFPHSSGANLGIVGVLALSIAKQSSGDKYLFGAL
jgi:hypothetical protein